MTVLVGRDEKLDGRYIWRYHHDMPKAYSGIRDLDHYLNFDSPVRYLPSAHFATEEKKAFLFPASFELVTTMRLFSTGAKRKVWAFKKQKNNAS